ncbi:MAG: sigma-70 family RNA polymerase sigma factor [Pirellulaceae bacterium]
MTNFPETRISLILRLAHPQDVAAWQEFVDVYAPAVYRLAKLKGMQAADAEDLTQETLFGVARAIDRFRPDVDRARFRTWLSRIARNLIADHFAGRAKRPLSQAISDSWLDDLTHDDGISEDAEFESEYRQSVFRVAANKVAQRVSATVWEAFEATAVRGQPAEQIAAQLGMSLGGLYVARCRVLKMLRSEVEQMEQAEALR